VCAMGGSILLLVARGSTLGSLNSKVVSWPRKPVRVSSMFSHSLLLASTSISYLA
jgi:hypothetical protein